MINENDPRLLAYVLGELSETEVREIDAAIQTDPQLAQSINDYRQLADALTGIFASEPLPDREGVEIRAASSSTIKEWRWTRFALQATLVLFVCAGLYAITHFPPAPGSHSTPPLISFVENEDAYLRSHAESSVPSVQFISPQAEFQLSGSPSDLADLPTLPPLPKRTGTPESADYSDFGYSGEELLLNNPPASYAVSLSTLPLPPSWGGPVAKPVALAPGMDWSIARRPRTRVILRKNVALPSQLSSNANRYSAQTGVQTGVGIRNQPEAPRFTFTESPFVSPIEKPVSEVSVETTAEPFYAVRNFILDMGLLPPVSVVDVSRIVNYYANQSYENQQIKERSEADVSLGAEPEKTLARQENREFFSDPSALTVRVQLGDHPCLPNLWLAFIVVERESGLPEDAQIRVRFNPTQIGSYRRIGEWTPVQTPDDPISRVSEAEVPNVVPNSDARSSSVNGFVKRFVAVYEIVPLSALENPVNIPGPSGYAQRTGTVPDYAGNGFISADVNATRQEINTSKLGDYSESGPALITKQQKGTVFSSIIANFGQDEGAFKLQLFQVETLSASQPACMGAKCRFFIPPAETIAQTSNESDFRFMAAVVLWSQSLVSNPYAGQIDLSRADELLHDFQPTTPWQIEFLEMLRKTKELLNPAP